MTKEQRTVLITGAAGGIGSRLSEAYAEAGYRVAMTDVEASRGEAAAAAIGGRVQAAAVRFLAADLAKPSEITSLFEQLDEAGYAPDVLINNAGFGINKSPYELTVEDWDSVINVNLRGTFLCAREAGRRMRTRGGGRIINISSTRAYMSEPHTEAYAATKGGIAALTHAMAASFADDGITVNCISPGWIETGNYDALRDADHSQHWSGRVGKPDDIARACLFLSDPANVFINGTNVTVDGGMTRKMIYEE
ncbi:3-ketoacyl-ACP reductase [Paenibacillus darwinianus]|uniref:3-ketoacyl-ACP reductase n=1 Tax=Paenibacillus darwinianus TaxID=1380763 RepID=A0A9W5S0P6_9BACL|nr:SDR family oxidoreductase [Paenibacillus darwinianus]EXX87705.1 3-ketoacyl-ACP reductase [Paenibacillus darwinianus]EXX90016.1 3-ketoacyl-ACP reductase [Paenibacillus darwinianus]EXX90829.1 3-ketoacyl-ACP reductase [Paenibacillus darwinianus]